MSLIDNGKEVFEEYLQAFKTVNISESQPSGTEEEFLNPNQLQYKDSFASE